jgi:hypothetical protein
MATVDKIAEAIKSMKEEVGTQVSDNIARGGDTAEEIAGEAQTAGEDAFDDIEGDFHL